MDDLKQKVDSLSQREAEVVEQVAKGLSNKEVGMRLFVTEKTIKFHLTNIYKKLGVTRRSQLIVLYASLGLPKKEEKKPDEPVIDVNTTNLFSGFGNA